MAPSHSRWTLKQALWTSITLASGVMGGQILQTNSFSDCGSDASIKVQRLNISYNNTNKTVTFDVAGTSTKSQNVTASLNVMAYGNSVFHRTFNPCDPETLVMQLCPLPVGTFAAKGSQAIPPQFASLIPSIAFQVPDIAAQATLQLDGLNTGTRVACIESQVSNDRTVNLPVISYVAAGVAGAALVLTGVSAASAAVAGGSAAVAGVAGGAAAVPAAASFVQVASWFQGMAMNGMLSVNYPPIYRSFSKNFAFSTGLVPWTPLLTAIDNFRAKTGGNLTHDSVQFLRNATLMFPDGSTTKPDNSFLKAKRTIDLLADLVGREINTSISAAPSSANGGDLSKLPTNIKHAVSGIQAFAEQLSVPKSDIFMTALLVVAMVIAAIAVGILLIKAILEAWATFGSFPKSLAGFRKHYWRSIGRTITSLILLLYGIWVLYCVFQFTLGDSWAAKVLAGVSLAIFTGILGFFIYKIWSTARKLKSEDGSASRLYEDKSFWVKYSMFYESYRQDYWWVFIPTIAYMFVKGCVLAAGDGHGMVQTILMLIVEAVMLVLLVWSRPYERRSSNIINIVIAVVRVLSVICILVFVEEFGIKQTTQTVMGVVMIAVQSTLTAVLAILILWNAITACCTMNPHRKRRKEMEKARGDFDDLTPLDARNSLLLAGNKTSTEASMYSFASDYLEKQPITNTNTYTNTYTNTITNTTNTNTNTNTNINTTSIQSSYPTGSIIEDAYYRASMVDPSGPLISVNTHQRTLTPPYIPSEATRSLVQDAAGMGHHANHSRGSSLGKEYGTATYTQPREFISSPYYGGNYQPPHAYNAQGYRGF